MALTDVDDAGIEFDPFSATFFDDPYDVYAQLRDHRPVYRNDHYGFYALSRWDDVVAASRDWATFSSSHGVDLHHLTTLRGRRPEFDSLIMIDPPKHDRLRALVSRVFTPRSIATLEPMIREVIGGYFDAVEGHGSFDAVQDVSAPFPVEIISRMLGVPPSHRQQGRHWLDTMLTREEGQRGFSAEAEQAAVEMGTFFYELSVAKRADPTDDMLSRLTQVEVEGDDGELTGLDDVEIAGFGTLIGGAGAETVTKLVGNAVVLFDQHPDQWQLVLDDPATIPGAVEEILRIHPPSQYQGRWSMRDVELHGKVAPAGSKAVLVLGSANRDDRVFSDPDRFDISRDPDELSQLLSFGGGRHFCLGANLARLEARIALTELVRRVRSVEVDHDACERVHSINVRGFASVPVRTVVR